MGSSFVSPMTWFVSHSFTCRLEIGNSSEVTDIRMEFERVLSHLQGDCSMCCEGNMCNSGPMHETDPVQFEMSDGAPHVALSRFLVPLIPLLLMHF